MARGPRHRPRSADARTGTTAGALTTAGQLVVHIPDGRPRIIDLEQDAILFGRSPSSTVRLEDPYVSDDHARIYQADGSWMVADCKSTNGTFLNRVKVTTPTQIAAGDQLGIGKTIVEVRK